MQWHPIFAQLLRPLLQDHYQVDTNVPVGDAPREADIVLLRRTSEQAPSYHGLWQHLTTWNVLEFKGPTVDPRLRDLDLLVELGLGIDRRLNEDRTRQRLELLEETEVSFWYLATHLGQRFLAEAARKLGPVVEAAPGLWRCEIMQRVVYLVSIDRVPVDHNSVPMHLLAREAPETGLAVGRVVIQEPGFWQLYSSMLALMHRDVWEEIQQMARANGIETTLDLRPLFKLVGVKQVINQLGSDPDSQDPELDLRPLFKMVGLNQVIDQLGSDPTGSEAMFEWLESHATPEQRRKLALKWQQPDKPATEAPE